MFTYKIETIISNVVVTIGVKYMIPKVIVTVIWSWADDEGQLHTNKLNNEIYFPDLIDNILITTYLLRHTYRDGTMHDLEIQVRVKFVYFV